MKPEARNDEAWILLTNKEAAAYVRVSPRTLEKWRLLGMGPRWHKTGPSRSSTVLYKQSALRAWLEGTDYGSTSEYDW